MTEPRREGKRYAVPVLVAVVLLVGVVLVATGLITRVGHGPGQQDAGDSSSLAPPSYEMDSEDVTAGSSVSRSPDTAAGRRRRHDGNAAGDKQVTLNQLRGSMPGLVGIALSPEGARWKSRQGMLIGAVGGGGPYAGLSVDKLAQMAKHGDVRAAIVAGNTALARASQASANSEAAVARSSGTDGASRRHGPPTSETAFGADAATGRRVNAQERARELYWHGVVHGSSYAARMMVLTYQDGLGGTCQQPVACNAWTLVGWRMGDWKATPLQWKSQSTNPYHAVVVLARAIEKANIIWARVNAARARLGLAPLRIDLRPSYRKWQRMKADPAAPATVYLP